MNEAIGNAVTASERQKAIDNISKELTDKAVGENKLIQARIASMYGEMRSILL